jgi:small subunit ribosomal protein S19
MAKKEFIYKGKKVEELKSLGLNGFIELVPSRQKRSLKRGFTDAQKILMKKIDNGKNNIKTHCRDLVIIPKMIGLTIRVYNGKEFTSIIIEPEMIGHFLGEFSQTRKRMTHSSPGVGSTRSSAHVSVK